jgi:signal peptidase I
MECMSYSDGWTLKREDFADGRDALRSIINECIENGYAYSHRYKGKNGKLGEYRTFISYSKEDIELIKKELNGTSHKRANSEENPETDKPSMSHDDCEPQTDKAFVENYPSSDKCEPEQAKPSMEYKPETDKPVMVQTNCEQNKTTDDEYGPEQAKPFMDQKGNFGSYPYTHKKNLYKKTTTEDPGDVVVFSHIEVRKEESPEVEKPKEPKAPKIWSVLQSAKLDEVKHWSKVAMTKRFKEEVVNNAVEYTLHPDTVIKTTLGATLWWACENEVKVEKSAKEIAEEEASDKQKQRAERIAKHRALALSYQGRDLGGLRVTVGQDMVDIRHPNQRTVFVLFNEEGFPEMLDSHIKSFTAKQATAMEKTHNINYHDVPSKKTEIIPLPLKSVIPEKSNDQNKMIEENREYALQYHLKKCGNVEVYVNEDNCVEFKNTVENKYEYLLYLSMKGFKEDFHKRLVKHNFPLLELCEAGA